MVIKINYKSTTLKVKIGTLTTWCNHVVVYIGVSSNSSKGAAMYSVISGVPTCILNGGQRPAYIF